MKSIPIHEARIRFAELIQQTLAGEEVIITDADMPLVQLFARNRNLASL